MAARLRLGIVWLAALVAVAARGEAQGLSQAVEELGRGIPVVDGVRSIDGRRLYGGVVCATITNQDADPGNLGDSDLVAFRLLPSARIADPSQPCRTPGGLVFNTGENGEQFEHWADANRQALFNVLFPVGLTSALIGRDAGQVYAQQLLMSTILGADGTRRPGAGDRPMVGGLIEYEGFRRDDSPGRMGQAWQGLYDFNRMLSVQARHSRQSGDLQTMGLTSALDFHPFVEFNRAIVWRVGGLARGGFTYASSSSSAVAVGASASEPVRMLSFDLGGGGWVSGFKDLGRTRVAGGLVLQGTDSHVPGLLLSDSTQYVAAALNDRALAVDVSWGASVGYDLTNRTALVAKVVQTDNLRSGLRQDPNAPVDGLDLSVPSSRTGLFGIAIRSGALRYTGGYRGLWGRDVTAHAVFFRGNFDW